MSNSLVRVSVAQGYTSFLSPLKHFPSLIGTIHSRQITAAETAMVTLRITPGLTSDSVSGSLYEAIEVAGQVRHAEPGGDVRREACF